MFRICSNLVDKDHPLFASMNRSMGVRVPVFKRLQESTQPIPIRPKPVEVIGTGMRNHDNPRRVLSFDYRNNIQNCQNPSSTTSSRSKVVNATDHLKNGNNEKVKVNTPHPNEITANKTNKSPVPISTRSVGCNTENIEKKRKKGPCKSYIEAKKVITSCEDKITTLWNTMDNFNVEVTKIIEAFPNPQLFHRPERTRRVFEEDNFPAFKEAFNANQAKAVENKTVPRKEVSNSNTDPDPDVIVTQVLTNQVYDCHICSKRFATLLLCQNHEKSHIPVTPREPVQFVYQCTICKESFPSVSSLVEHKMTEHVINSLLACPTCKKFFKNKHGLNIHKSRAKN